LCIGRCTSRRTGDLSTSAANATRRRISAACRFATRCNSPTCCTARAADAYNARAGHYDATGYAAGAGAKHCTATIGPACGRSTRSAW